jgi:trimethylamine--corrinoid protein Co-methyltransferase
MPQESIGYGQFVIDNEIIGMAMKMVAGIEVDADRLAIDVISEAGPGGNFFSTRHTRKYLRDEYLEPMLMPRDERATEIIEGHETLAVPPAIDKEIRKRYSILC